MKHFFFLVLSLTHLFCLGQSKSRILFFRMDADLDAHSSAFSETRLHSDMLFLNERPIRALKSCSVFIYDSTDVRGTYYLLPHGNNSDWGNKKVTVSPGESTITIIKLSLHESTLVYSQAEVVDSADFEKYYNKTKWLRNKLTNEGYTSVKALFNGFKINENEINEFNYSTRRSKRLNDTTFYNKRKEMTFRDSANYYKIVSQEKEKYYSVKSYFVANNQLEMTGHYSDIDSEIKEGPFIYYTQKGRLGYKGIYNNDKQNGTWEHYYDTLNSPLWYTCDYDNGNRKGMLTSYYLTGKIKRKEFHELIDKSIATKPRSRKMDVLPQTQDTITYGNCYDENGNEIIFTPFEIMPKPQYDINKILRENISYPSSAKENKEQGRVVVKFVINEKGEITDVHVVKHVSPDIDAEAIRVVSLLPDWLPAIQDDKVVKVIYSLPIIFKLQ